jgi:uncharacterized membrane protein YhaH (DUF805 family)
MDWYIKVIKSCTVFEGRASRQEYWMFFLFNLIISFCIGIVEGILQSFTKTDQSVLGNIYTLAILLPSIAVAIRRMHDTNRSGWWSIVPIAGLVFLFEAGHPGENKYGRNPNERKS